MAEGWSRTEVEATVADYFVMLDLELRGQPFFKTDHIRRLAPLLDGRSEGAIQYKYGNISAVLEDLGLPFVDGFKPYSNYQQLLFDVVNDRVTRDRPLLTMIKKQVDTPGVAPKVADILASLVTAPEKSDGGSSPTKKWVKELGNYRPIDYLAREANNQSLGAAGEEFVLRFEQARLAKADRANLADRVELVSHTQGDWLGFDIKSYEVDGSDRFIEVKTTRYGKLTPFYVSRNEVHTSMEQEQRYHLFRVFHFDRATKVFNLAGRLDRSCRLDPVSSSPAWVEGRRMRLEDLQPDATVRGILPDALVTVVSVAWYGSDALTLVYRAPERPGRGRAPLPPRRAAPRGRRAGPPLELRRRRRALPARLRGAPHPPRASVRSGARGPHLARRAAAAPDHRGLRGDAAAPAAALPARRRPRRRQDDHGRAAHQGADRARRPPALPHRLPRQPRRAVAGRAVPALPPALRDPDQRQARGRAHRQLVPRERPRHRPPRQALAQRGRAAEAQRARTAAGTSSSATRRTSSRPPSSAARSSTPSATGSASSSRRSRATSC